MLQQAASEQIALVESLGGSGTGGDGCHGDRRQVAVPVRWLHCCAGAEVIIDSAAGDPAQDNVVTGSPLAMALALRGCASLVASAARAGATTSKTPWRSHEPLTPPRWPSSPRGTTGCPSSTACALTTPRSATSRTRVQVAEASGDNNVLASVRYMLGTVLVIRGGATDRQRGRELLARGPRHVREASVPAVRAAADRADPAHTTRPEMATTTTRYPKCGSPLTNLFDQRQYVYHVGATALLSGDAVGPRRRG